MHITPSLAGVLGTSIGPMELFAILFVVMLLFGAKRLPELARSIGKSMREFKKAASEVEDNFHNAVAEEDRKNLSSPAPAKPVAPAVAARAPDTSAN